jgi:hypothetical protein
VPGDVGKRLGRREVRRVLGLARQPPGQGRIDRDRERCLVGELAEGRRQPEVGEDLRLDAVDQVPQVGHQLPGLLVRGGHGLRGRPGRQVEPGQPELHGERDQLLLGAVVQVTLDAAALGLERAGEPGTGRRDLGELRAQPCFRPAAEQQRAGDRRVRPGDQRHQVRPQDKQDQAREEERHGLRHGRGPPGEQGDVPPGPAQRDADRAGQEDHAQEQRGQRRGAGSGRNRRQQARIAGLPPRGRVGVPCPQPARHAAAARHAPDMRGGTPVHDRQPPPRRRRDRDRDQRAECHDKDEAKEDQQRDRRRRERAARQHYPRHGEHGQQRRGDQRRGQRGQHVPERAPRPPADRQPAPGQGLKRCLRGHACQVTTPGRDCQ